MFFFFVQQHPFSWPTDTSSSAPDTTCITRKDGPAEIPLGIKIKDNSLENLARLLFFFFFIILGFRDITVATTITISISHVLQ